MQFFAEIDKFNAVLSKKLLTLIDAFDDCIQNALTENFTIDVHVRFIRT
jgi:hypothetical protein